MADLDDKAKLGWEKAKNKLKGMDVKAQAKYHETRGRLDEKMKQREHNSDQ
jgi:hypothetical protein